MADPIWRCDTCGREKHVESEIQCQCGGEYHYVSVDSLLEICTRIEREHLGWDKSDSRRVCTMCRYTLHPCDALRAARALRVLVEFYLAHAADDCPSSLCMYCGNADLTDARKAAKAD